MRSVHRVPPYTQLRAQGTQPPPPPSQCTPRAGKRRVLASPTSKVGLRMANFPSPVQGLGQH